jgi:putative oxidoreductase
MLTHLHDAVILVARLFLAALFLIFGWRKLRDYPGTVAQIAGDGVPLPRLAAAASIVMELPVAFAIALGAATRPAALLMALYTLGTSMVEHRHWAIKGPDKLKSGWLDKMEAFYKNLAIMGGFLLLATTGAGPYSLDAWLGLP